MNELSLQQTLLTDIGQAVPEPPYPVLQWQYRLSTKQFQHDSDAFSQLLAPEKPLNSLYDILQYLTKKGQRSVKALMMDVVKNGGFQHANCSLLPNQDLIAYAELTFEKIEPDLIQGTLRPLILIPNQLAIANVFEAIFDNPHHGIILTDDETRILACNHYFEQQSGYRCNEIIGLKTRIFNADKHSPEFYQAMWQDIRHKGFWSGALLSRTASGAVIPQELTIQRLPVGKNKYVYLGMSVDLSNNPGRIADKDHGGVELLTQLPTKQKFMQLAKQLCAIRDQTQKIFLVFNSNIEEQNHELKQRVADALTQNHSASLAGYFANNLFAVCVEAYPQKEVGKIRGIQLAIRKFFQEIKRDSSEEVHRCLVSGRIGVSVIGYDANSAEAAVVHATQAMLEMHSGQDSHISFFHREIHESIMHRRILENAVANAIKEYQLQVYYQPIIDTSDWLITKFEALCRFVDEQGEPYDTQQMVSIAEDLDLVVEMDNTVAEMALAGLAEIQHRYGAQLGISINRSLNAKVSATELLTKTLDIINQNASKPEDVTIELTESAYFDSESTQSSALQQLRDMGVSIAIDDFGTGYSSFNYLSDCHFDILKIDRDFVHGIHPESNTYNIVKMITQLSHKLNVKVVAEGVETLDEVRILKSLGIDYMQGFFFAKPKPIERLDEVLGYRDELPLELFDVPAAAVEGTLQSIAHPGVRRLDPGEPLSLTFEYMKARPNCALPVVTDDICVGIITQADLNLHLTPAMGSDHETTYEASVWRKPANRIMSTDVTSVAYDTPLEALGELIKEFPQFPWILIDEEGCYRGLLEQNDALLFLIGGVEA
ncbi:EAL domain-containing protein [Vibrio sp.]|uniref:EAL domain-containing protein n=1 Tax=Vibrio sp. TaxID=678 RepID=UPI003D0B0C3F